MGWDDAKGGLMQGSCNPGWAPGVCTALCVVSMAKGRGGVGWGDAEGGLGGLCRVLALCCSRGSYELHCLAPVVCAALCVIITDSSVSDGGGGGMGCCHGRYTSRRVALGCCILFFCIGQMGVHRTAPCGSVMVHV